MNRIINPEDFKIANEVIMNALISNSQLQDEDSEAQQLSAIIDLLLLKVTIPLFVSLTSSLLAEVVKGRLFSSLKRKEAEQVLNDLLNKKLNPQPQLQSEDLEAVRNLLNPLGISDEDINKIYFDTKQKISGDKNL